MSLGLYETPSVQLVRISLLRDLVISLAALCKGGAFRCTPFQTFQWRRAAEEAGIVKHAFHIVT
jgi:hypothetical protein